MKQTAVEWLLSKLKDYVNPVASDHNSYSIRIPKSDMVNAIEQAKAMETEQTDKGYYDGVNDERKNTLRYKYFKYKKSIEEQTK